MSQVSRWDQDHLEERITYEFSTEEQPGGREGPDGRRSEEAEDF